MKKKKKKLSMSLSVLIIGFLVSTSSLSLVSTEALVEEKDNQYYTDSFDRSDWKWTTTEVVSTESTGSSYVPSLVVDSAGDVHIAWSDVTDYAGAGGELDIFYKFWNATSESWNTTVVVSTESVADSYDPSIAVDSTGNVHIAWEDLTDYAGSGTDRDIFYKRWDASSSSWTLTEVVFTISTEHAYDPSLVSDYAGNIHIAWHENTDYAGAGTDTDIFYKRWDASTSSWTTTEVVSTESTGSSAVSSLAVDSTGNVHIAWEDFTDYAGSGIDRDIFYKRWDASSSSWTLTEVVSTESTSRSYPPSLAVDSAGNVLIAWHEQSSYAGSGSDVDIFYKRWDASSSSWATTEVVSTESTSTSKYPSLAVDSAGTFHIAWEDYTDYAGAGTDTDIFYKQWDASFFSWTTTEVVSTESTANSYNPSLAVDTLGKVHIAWEDVTNYSGAGTDSDIFYKLFTDPPAAPELAFIVPNPTELTTVNLDWNNVLRATSYHVYRSTSYIWSVDGLEPIATVALSEYVDSVPSEGIYYYVVVAESLVGNSSHSNCQYVEVKFLDLKAPEIAPILPNPTDSSSISLVWDSIDGAIEYYIYRSVSYIWSVEGLTSLVTVSSNSYIDTLPSEGYYFYVIVANDGVRNSIHSNCEYVEYKVPHLREFSIISGLILAAFVLVFVVTRIRKRNFKPN
ncbi:MAG: hypothetical protein KAU62_11045 [Candidatus Heimdallarchaeota archaeon]|nr:hypothetical protein [Candidatus Heimdallarchaeota archaeon]MCK4611682.1 hypothetical protein [Candidatus Heimdallarchaeota archaeon]